MQDPIDYFSWGPHHLFLSVGFAARGGYRQRLGPKGGERARWAETSPSEAAVEGGSGGVRQRLPPPESRVYRRGTGPIPGPTQSPCGGGPGGSQKECGGHLPRGLPALPGERTPQCHCCGFTRFVCNQILKSVFCVVL